MNYKRLFVSRYLFIPKINKLLQRLKCGCKLSFGVIKILSKRNLFILYLKIIFENCHKLFHYIIFPNVSILVKIDSGLNAYRINTD